MTASTVLDTMVGTVSEVGSDPATWLTITPADGSFEARLTGDSSRALRSVLGAEVWIRGNRQRDGREFVVNEFMVRSVNGVSVDDGVVARSDSGLELIMRSGRRRALPAELERAVGSRVWVSRPVTGRAPSFGIIASR